VLTAPGASDQWHGEQRTDDIAEALVEKNPGAIVAGSSPEELTPGAAGLPFTEGTLEQVELANKPGALAQLAGRLAKKGINIDSAYATMPKGAKKAVVVLALSGPTL